MAQGFVTHGFKVLLHRVVDGPLQAHTAWSNEPRSFIPGIPVYYGPKDSPAFILFSWPPEAFYGVWFVCLFVGCLTSQQHASVPQGRICSDNFTCCHTQVEVADQTIHLTQSQYTDIGPTSLSVDPVTPDVWQGSHWNANFLCHWYDSTSKKIPAQAGFEPGIFRSRGGRLTTRPTRWFCGVWPLMSLPGPVCTTR